MPDRQHHRIFRIGWLRAAVLGANDGIISTACLIAGVAAAQSDRPTVLLSGLAALVAGALSMAAGEYVSVRSQADTEAADLEMERSSLRRNAERELDELVGIYVERGLTPELARQVALQLTRHDALDAHARDELGITLDHRARPVQAAVASACSFATGSLLPLLLSACAPLAQLIPVMMTGSVIGLGVLGAVSAQVGGAPLAPAALRVMLLGAAAMAVTAAVGAIFGVAV